MNNLNRALWDALAHSRWLVLAVLCSATAAGIWGANIAALFPILEVTLHGESLHDWNRRLTQEARHYIDDAKVEIEKLKAAQQNQKPNPETPEANIAAARISDLQMTILREETTLASCEATAAWIDDWMPSTPFGVVAMIVVAIAIGTTIRQVLLVANQVIVGYVGLHIARDVRRQIFDKALAMDRGSFLSHGSSSFVAFITQTSDMLAGGVSNVYGGAISEPLKLAACLAGAAFISWRLMLACLVMAPICGLAILWLNSKMRVLAKEMLNKSAGFHHVLLESLGSMLTVQACNQEDQERRRFDQSTDEMLGYSLASIFYQALTGPITEALGIGMTCVAVLLGSYLVINHETTVFGIMITETPLSVSALMVFFGMLIGATDPARKMAGVISGINSGMVAADQLYPILDKPSSIRDPEQPRSVASPHRSLELRGVTFGYHTDRPVVRDIDLTIPLGEMVVVIGPNGGGKSTLVNLICRFYDPQQGEVSLDGVPLTEMMVADLRGRIGLVTQHTELFNESVLYNIRYGRPDATDVEVFEAARRAYAADFIENMPEKYGTVVGPGGQRLSGGQRQRIALARAFLRDPEILILDEATSQIDAESEQLIHDSLEEFAQGRTVILISHRTSALCLGDRILEVRDGQIQEQVQEQFLEPRAA